MLKTLLTVVVLLSLFAPAIAQTKPVLHIFLVGGQSNAVGVDSSDGLSSERQKLQQPLEGVPFYYKVWPGDSRPDTEQIYTTLRPGAGGASLENSFGPELSYGHALHLWHQKSHPDDKVAIIKFARGGTHLYGQWKPNGTESSKGDGSVYRMFQEVVTAGLKTLADDPDLEKYEHRVQAMAWVQGEADLSHDHAKDYADNLTTLIQDVRATFGSEIEFYFTRISDNQTLYLESDDAKKVANFHLIRDKQKQVGNDVAGAFMVDIDPPEFSMLKQKHYFPLFLHFDADGTAAIGEAFADAYIEYQTAGNQ